APLAIPAGRAASSGGTRGIRPRRAFRSPRFLAPPSPITDQTSTLLHETRRFPPDPALARASNGQPALYEAARAARLAFWEEQARALDWITPWHTVLEWAPPHAKWFVGGKLNIAANCLDRHLHTARRNKAAIIWEGEPGD